MATVVPISHCRRYRSRSRTASVESTPSLPRTSSTGSLDSDSETDEEWLADSPEASPGLVMPYGFASPEARQRVATPLGTTYISSTSWVLADPKAMERRRAIESRD